MTTDLCGEAAHFWRICKAGREMERSGPIDAAMGRELAEEIALLLRYSSWPLLRQRCAEIMLARPHAFDSADLEAARASIFAARAS